MRSKTQHTVLIVEDAPEDRVTYRRYLAQDPEADYTIIEATTCERAIEMCRDQLPDCILLDFFLPDGNGLEVLRQIIAEHGEDAIGIVMLTGAGDTGLAVDSMKSGAHDFLVKSYMSPATLHRAVANAIEKVDLRHEIEQQRKWFHITLASIGDAVIATDIHGRITFVNPVAEALTGWLAADAYAQPLEQVFRIVNETSRQPVDNPASKVLQEGTVVGLANHTILIAKDGRETPIDDSGAPIRDAYGNLIGVVLVFRDITERRLAEAEREDLLVREEEAREAAESANRLKDEFLAAVSHELRTPLNSILGWARIAQMSRSDSDTMKHALDVIVRSARSQNQLIEDILDVSRIVTGKLNLNMQPIDLEVVIRGAIQAAQPALDAKRIHFEAHYDAPNSLVSGDADRLQQILWNLLSNSIKFTATGGDVEIRLERKGEQVQITVSDNGEGIDRDFLPFVFDRFRQAEGGTTRKHGGLGLGLAIARHLTEIHGGSIWAESEGKGKGSSFVVSLPVLLAGAEAIGNPSTILRSDTPVPDRFPEGLLAGACVLVVDDEPDALELISVVLSKHGAEVVAVVSSEEALSKIRERTPDLLVSDIGLLNKDGYALIHEIRALHPDRGGRIPAIALTAYARDEDRRRAIAEGYQAHLAKPVEVLELVRVASELTAMQRRHGSIGAFRAPNAKQS